MGEWMEGWTDGWTGEMVDVYTSRIGVQKGRGQWVWPDLMDCGKANSCIHLLMPFRSQLHDGYVSFPPHPS